MARDSRRFQVARGTSPRIGVLPRGEVWRMASLFLLAVIVTLFVMMGLGSERKGPRIIPPKAPATGVALEVEDAVIPWSPPVRQLNRIIHQSTRSERILPHPDALGMLGEMVWKRFHTHFRLDPKYRDAGGYRRLSMKELLDPALSLELRGEPVELHGEIEDWRKVDPKIAFGLDPSVFDQPLAVATAKVQGSRVDVLVLERDPPPARGPHHKILGVFYRLRDVPVEVERDGQMVQEYVTAPFILAKRVVPMVPLKLVESLPENLARNIKDATNLDDIGEAPQRDPNFYTLAGYVLAHRGKPAFEHLDAPLLRGRGIVEEPDKYRLEPLTVRGEIVYMNWESFEYEDMREGDAPSLGYWHCMISDAQPGRNPPVSLLIPWKDLPPGIGKNAVVKAHGVFFRVGAYEDREGRMMKTPFVIATSDMVSDRVEFRNESNAFLVTVIAIGVLLTICLTMMLVRDRRRSAGFSEQFRKKRASRHQDLDVGGGQADGTPPPGAP